MIRTFTLAADTEVYKNYFKQLEEQEKYRELMCKFLDKYNINCNKYYIGSRLMLKLNNKERILFDNQICKDSSDELTKFKIKSDLNQKYLCEVYNNVNADNLFCNKYWTFGLFKGKLKYDLWNWNSKLYGFMEGDNITKLPKDADEITNSTYYRAYADAVKFLEEQK